MAARYYDEIGLKSTDTQNCLPRENKEVKLAKAVSSFSGMELPNASNVYSGTMETMKKLHSSVKSHVKATKI